MWGTWAAMSNGTDMVDYFVSRRGSAAAAAQEVADVLASAHYRVTIQDYDIPYGENFVAKMHEALKKARHFVALLTKDYDTAPFTQEEWTNFLAVAAPAAGERRLVVLRVEDCAPTGLFAGRVYGDLVGVTDPERRRDIILAAAEGRSLARPRAPRIIRNIPPNNPGFIGRKGLLDELHRVLTAADRPTAITQAAIHGLGGIGKTTLAAEYAYRHLDHYAAIWWASAESRTLLIESLAELGGVLDGRRGAAASEATGAKDVEAQAKAALQKLGESEKPWLLVYDNVKDPDDVRDLVPATGARILITTRWTNWYGQAVPIEIDVLAPREAADLLLRITGRTDRKGATQLARALGCLPLALDHAGAYIADTGMSFARYVERAAEFIAKAPKGANYPKSVSATFRLAIEKAIDECAAAEKLLAFLSMLAPDQIPHDLTDAVILPVGDRDDALAALHRVSLIRYQANESDGNQAIFVHRLVRAATHARLKEAGKLAEALAVAVGRVAGAYPDRGYSDPTCWPRCKELLPHVLALREMARQAGVESEQLADVLDAAGNYLLGRGAFSDAEPLFSEAIDIGRRVLGREHLKVGQWLNNLGNLYLNSGRYSEAESCYWQAISIGAQTLGEDHPGVATRLNNLAKVLLRTGRASLAEKYFRKAIHATEKALGREHPTVAARRHNLANLLRDTGRREKADRLYRKVVAIGEKALGPDNFQVCNWRKDRANLLRDMGKYDEAESLYREVLARLIATVGAGHLAVAFTREDLSELLLLTNRLDEAHQQAAQAVAIHQQTFDAKHRWTQGAAQVLARILEALGRGAEAAQVCARHALDLPQARAS